MWKWDTFIDFAKSGIQGESWYQGKNKGSKFKTHNPNIELMSEIELKFKKKKKKLDSKPSGEEGSSMEEIFYF